MTRPLIDSLAVRVYYEDTDFSGRVYHASYLRFLERARTEWLRRLGLSHQQIAETTGVVFAVRRLQIEYLAPALMDDLLAVETKLSKLRGASIEFRQRILRAEKEIVAATVLVAALRESRPARIPLPMLRLFETSS